MPAKHGKVDSEEKEGEKAGKAEGNGKLKRHRARDRVFFQCVMPKRSREEAAKKTDSFLCKKSLPGTLLYKKFIFSVFIFCIGDFFRKSF